jgi:hypothetical protein
LTTVRARTTSSTPVVTMVTSNPSKGPEVAVKRTATGSVPACGAETSRTLIGELPSPGTFRVIVRHATTACLKDFCKARTAAGEPIASILSSMNGPCAPPEYD